MNNCIDNKCIDNKWSTLSQKYIQITHILIDLSEYL